MDEVRPPKSKADAATTPGNDCYSAGERQWMERGQHLRAIALAPLLKGLTALRVRPDFLTIASLLAGLGFLPLWLVNQHVAALMALAAHVLLDGLDGPLARYQSRESPRGSFTDSFCDQMVVTAVTIGLMIGTPKMVESVPGALYLVLYTAVVAMAMVRNSLKIPYAWLIRPRFFLFAAIPLGLAGFTWIVPLIVWASIAVLAAKVVSGFVRLRQRLRGPRDSESA